MKKVDIFIDGSCLNNGRKDAVAGWAVVIKGSVNKKLYGKLPGEHQYNLRAELYSLLMAFEWLRDNPKYRAAIHSDSKEVIGGVLGYSTRRVHRDLWERIELLCPVIASQLIDLRVIKRDDNGEAHALAKVAANALIIFNQEEQIDKFYTEKVGV